MAPEEQKLQSIRQESNAALSPLNIIRNSKRTLRSSGLASVIQVNRRQPAGRPCILHGILPDFLDVHNVPLAK